MNKSPISNLQEILVKEGCYPNYSYSFHVSDFKCEVTCKNLSAIGIGNNKKEAKHNAAINMLSLLNVTTQQKEHMTANTIQNLNIYEQTCNNDELNSINTSFLLKTQTFPEYNYIGLLQELCTQYRLDWPLYEVVEQSGPSHMRTFKIKGSCGSYEMTGMAHCKKTAKQEAAKNLLHHLIVSNTLPKDAHKKIELYRKTLNNNSTDMTIRKSSLESSEPVLSTEIAEITEVSEKALSTCVESISNNTSTLNITDSGLEFNNNTIKNTHISICQPKSIETVNKCKQTSENNCKKVDGDKSVISSVFTKSSESALSNIKSNSNSTKEQNLVIGNGHANLSSTLIDKNKGHKRTIEDDLREFNIEISDSAKNNETLPLTELSRKALSEALENSERTFKPSNVCLKDSHDLFKRKYADKISDDLKKRMYIVSNSSKPGNCKLNISETYHDIQRALGVTLRQVNCSNYRTGVTIICLRMLSTPVIAQFGIGSTENDAKTEAMFAIINTILEYIK